MWSSGRAGNGKVSEIFRHTMSINNHLMDGVFGEEGLRLIVGDGRMDNDIITFLPVDRCGDTVLVA